MQEKNRISKWAKYREFIYNNIELHKEVIASNERLSLLYKRLLKVFPKYESLFKKEESFKFTTMDSPKVNTYDLKKIQTIINELNIDEEVNDLSYLEKTVFSTGELDTIIKELKEWDSGKEDAITTNKNSQTHIDNTKEVKL